MSLLDRKLTKEEADELLKQCDSILAAELEDIFYRFFTTKEERHKLDTALINYRDSIIQLVSAHWKALLKQEVEGLALKRLTKGQEPS